MLSENTTLVLIAEAYAIRLARNNVFEHSGYPNLGENLAYTWSSNSVDLKNCARNN